MPFWINDWTLAEIDDALRSLKTDEASLNLVITLATVYTSNAISFFFNYRGRESTSFFDIKLKGEGKIINIINVNYFSLSF